MAFQNLAEALNNNSNNITDLENDFQAYLTSSSASSLKLTDLITRLTAVTEPLDQAYVPRLKSSKKKFRHGQVMLTKALVHLITTHGLTAKGNLLNEKAITVLKNPVVMKLAYQNNHELIYQINRAVEQEQHKQEFAKKADEISRLLKAHYYPTLDELSDVQEKEIERAIKAIESFMFYLENPLEDEGMGQAMKDLLNGFQGLMEEAKEDAIEVIRFINNKRLITNNVQRWHFLNTVYGHYNNGEILALETNLLNPLQSREGDDVDTLVKDLTLVDDTHVSAVRKTQLQAVGMLIGGLALGTELANEGLSSIAQMSSLGPMAVLGISFGVYALICPLIALYFYMGHYNEMEKQNKLFYFAKHIKKTHPQNKQPEVKGWGKTVGFVGTMEEGLAAGALLMTLGSFLLLDLPTWAQTGGGYTQTLPGMFFAQNSPHLALTIVSFTVLAAVSLLLAACFFHAHYSLDMQEAFMFGQQVQEDREMRGVVNKDVPKETGEPLYFSWSLKARHKIDSFFESTTLEESDQEVEMKAEGSRL